MKDYVSPRITLWGTFLGVESLKSQAPLLHVPLQAVELYFYLQFSTFSSMYDSVQHRKYIFQIYMVFFIHRHVLFSKSYLS